MFLILWMFYHYIIYVKDPILVFQPQKPSMMKSISGSSLAASRQFSGSNLAAAAGMGRSVSGSSLSRNFYPLKLWEYFYILQEKLWPFD